MRSRPPRSRALPLVLVACAVAAVALGLRVALAPADAYWNLDNGARALAVAHLLRDPGATRLAYPGLAIDPELRFFPLPLRGEEPYGRVVGGGVVSAYLGPSAWLALPFAAWLGPLGLGVLPALGGGATVALAIALARRRTGSLGRAALAGGLVLAATPCLFYATVVWEHTVVAALALGALLCLEDELRPRAALAGGLLGAAALLREEGGVLLIAVAVGRWVAGRRAGTPALLGGGLAGVAAHATFQRVVTGAWTGVHLDVNRPEPWAHAGRAVRDLLLSPGDSGLSLVVPVLAIGLLLAASAPAFRDRPATTLRALAAALLAVVSGAAWVRYPAGGDGALALIGSSSAAVFVPWALVGPFLPREPAAAGRRDALVATVVLFAVAVVALAPARAISGVHPGPRLLFPVLPMLAVVLAERLRFRLSSAPVAIAVAVAVLWAGRALVLEQGKRTQSARIAAALAADPRRIVATDLFWLPTDVSSLWFAKELHLVSGPGDLAELARRAARAGQREMLVVVAAGSLEAPPVGTVRSASFPAFSVDLHVQPLRPAP